MKFHFLGEYFMTTIVCEVEIIKPTTKPLEHNYETFLLTIALVRIRLLLLGIFRNEIIISKYSLLFQLI